MAKQPPNSVEFNKIRPKTPNQSKFVKSIIENDIIFVDGPAGTGKTYLALNMACDFLLQGKVSHILISRTIIPCGEIGFLPGSASEKAAPYFAPHLYYIEKLLGKNYRKYISDNTILLQPTELLRGSNFENTFMVADEIQNFDIQQMKMWLSRMGQGSKIVCLGDQSQSDINATAFRFCLNNLGDVPGCSIISFDESDILRNDIIGKVLKVFRVNGF